MPQPFNEAAPLARLAEPVERVHQLWRGEQLILWSLRALALGHAEHPVLHDRLQAVLGASAAEMLGALFVAARLLGGAAARPLRLHAPGCDRVSEDERRLLDLFAEAQQALFDGDERRVRASLSRIVEPRLLEGLLMVLQAVTAPLEVGGYELPRRTPADRPAPVRRLH